MMKKVMLQAVNLQFGWGWVGVGVGGEKGI